MAAPRSLTITIPDTPQLDGARRRIDTARDRMGRLATAAGAAAAGVALFAPETAGFSMLATSAVTGGGLLALRLGQPPGHQRATTTALYLMPGTSLLVLLAAERLVSGIHWAEVLGAVAWTAATWLLRPARTAVRMVTPTPPPAPAVDVVLAEAEEVLPAHPAAGWWAQHAAVKGGAAPGTVLEDIELTGQSGMRAIIRAATPGTPVPDVSIRHLSALVDVPEDQISVTPVPGRGASVRRLAIGPAAQAADPATVWAQKIAPKAMPGAVLTGIRVSGAPAIDLTKEH